MDNKMLERTLVLISIVSTMVTVTVFVILMKRDIEDLEEEIDALEKKTAALECRLRYVEGTYNAPEGARARNDKLIFPGKKCEDLEL